MKDMFNKNRLTEKEIIIAKILDANPGMPPNYAAIARSLAITRQGVYYHVQNIKKKRMQLKAPAPTKTYGNANLNELFKFWETTIGYPIVSNMQKNRFAASTLVRRHGMDGVKSLIKGVAIAQKDKFAPRIPDFFALQFKTNDLLEWGKKHGTIKEKYNADRTN